MQIQHTALFGDLHDDETVAQTTERLARKDVFRRILVPVDFSDGARAALTVAFALRQSLGSKIDVVHLTSSSSVERTGAPAAVDDLLVEVTGALYRFVEATTGSRSGEAEVHVVLGDDVVGGIERAAERLGSTAIILSPHHKRAVLRTKTERIARRFPGAVLVVPSLG